MSIKNYRQNSSLFNEKIQKYGCYLFSILFHIEEIKNLNFKPSEINSFYEFCVKKSYMSRNCYILRPLEIFKAKAVFFKSIRHERDNSYKTRKFEREIACFKVRENLFHFVPSINFKPLWNSLNLSLKEKVKVSRRIFKF